jgi:protein O-mannosyl-transferase
MPNSEETTTLPPAGVTRLVRCNTYFFAANPSKSPLIQGETSKLPPLGKGGLRGVRFRCHMVLVLCLTSRWFHIALIMLTGIAVYINSLHVPFVMDDHYSIPYVGTRELGDTLLHGGARRIADITFALNYRFSRLSVAGYHITNLAIHLASAITLYFLVRAALLAVQSPKYSHRRNPSFIERFMPVATAMLFVCHPVQTQAVTYLIQRYTTLATCFYLVATLAFIKARLYIDTHGACWKTWLWGYVSLQAAILAFYTKQIAFTLPFMLVVLECCLFRGRLLNRRFIAVCCGGLIGAAFLVLFTWRADTLDNFLYDLRHATSEDPSASRSTYFFTQLRIVAAYLRLLCLPVNQSIFHDYPMYTTFFSAPVLASAILHLILLATAIILLRSARHNTAMENSSRSQLQCLAALGIFWFYLTLSVESSIIPIRDIMFEHRMYLPSAGFFMATCALGGLLVRERRSRENIAWSLLLVICLVLGGMTIKRNQIWSNPLHLWQDTAIKAPNNSLVLSNLANEYLSCNMPDKALPLYVRAIEINPNLFFRSIIGLGFTLQELKVSGSRFTTGQEFILPGGTLGSGGLDYGRYSEWEAVKHNNMGLAYEFMEEPEKSRKKYEIALFYRPSYDHAWYNLGLLADRQNDKAQLARAVDQLKVLNPTLADSLAAKTTF